MSIKTKTFDQVSDKSQPIYVQKINEVLDWVFYCAVCELSVVEAVRSSSGAHVVPYSSLWRPGDG